MHGLGEHEPLQMKVLGEAHVASVAPVVHRQVVALQHTPRHGAGEQEAPGKNVLGAAQFAAVTLAVQTHDVVQQAPRQGAGEQVAPQ
jgi:hypothetical protein